MAAPGPGSDSFSGWQLVATSATPTLIVCMLGAVGAALAHKGVLNAQGCQTVAKLCFYVFTPALTFAKLVQAISIGSIAHLWPLLANMTISIVVGLGVGVLVARLTRTPPEFRNIVVCAVSFGNVGNLPLVFVSTLCHDKQALFYRTLGEDCEHLGIAYTAFDIAAATLWQFTLAINLIRRSAAAVALAAAAAGREAAEPAGAASGDAELAGSEALPMRKEPTLSDLLKGRQGSSRGGSPAAGSPRDPLEEQQQQQQQHHHHHHQAQQEQEQLFHARPLGLALAPRQQLGSSRMAAQGELLPSPFDPTGGAHAQARLQVQAWRAVELQPVALLPHPQQQREQQHVGHLGWAPGHPHPNHSNGSPAEEEVEDTAALLGTKGSGGGSGRNNRAAGADGSSGSRAGGQPVQWGRAAGRYLRAVDWGAAFPLPSQAAILGIAVGCIPPLKALLYSPHPPLRVLSEALDTLGGGLIPTTIPLLGAVLYRGPGASRLPLRVTVVVVVTRLLLQPALLTALVVAALRLRLFTSPDAMFLLTLLLSNATPTAINMQTLTVLYKTGEGEMATLLFWQYLASVLTLPAYMWVFLRIIHTWP